MTACASAQRARNTDKPFKNQNTHWSPSCLVCKLVSNAHGGCGLFKCPLPNMQACVTLLSCQHRSNDATCLTPEKCACGGCLVCTPLAAANPFCRRGLLAPPSLCMQMHNLAAMRLFAAYARTTSHTCDRTREPSARCTRAALHAGAPRLRSTTRQHGALPIPASTAGPV